MKRRQLEDILDALSEAVSDESGAWRKLGQVERTALFPYLARGMIGNGGFKYCCEGEVPLAEAAHGFRELGFSDVANACEQVANAVFPEGREPDDWELRDTLVESADWERFRAELKIVWSLPMEALLKRIERHVEDHPADFRRWLS